MKRGVVFPSQKKSFIPLEKNTEIQVTAVTCLKLSGILILLVHRDTEGGCAKPIPHPGQAGSLTVI